MSSVNSTGAHSLVPYTPPVISQTPPAAPLIPNVQQHIQGAIQPSAPRKGWHERAITYLNAQASKLDAIPNRPIQDKLDAIGQSIEKHFVHLHKFNEWLDRTDNGKWYKQLALFLLKLPLRAARNIIHLLYNIIKGIVYTAVHPRMAIIKLGKLLVHLAHELTKPDTWSKMGIGMIGASLGTAATSGNPISVVGIGIGVAMLAGGLTFGALKAALAAQKGTKWQAAKTNLIAQAKELPESMMTGFLLGLIMGGIKNGMQQSQKDAFKITDQKSATDWVGRYTERYNIPTPDDVRYVSPSKILIEWDKNSLAELFKQKPILVDKFPNYQDFSRLVWTFNPTAAHHTLFYSPAAANSTPLLAAATNAGTILLKV